MLSAMRSLIDPPGLARSSLQKAETEDGKRRLILTMGVRPIVLRMLSKGAMASCAQRCGWILDARPCLACLKGRDSWDESVQCVVSIDLMSTHAL